MNEILNERPIEVITEEINFYKQTAGAAIIEIGKRLNEAKALLPHGEWGDWLSEKVDFSEATAQRFMRLANEYSNPSPVTDLGASKALILLALPPVEREEFIAEKHTVNGEKKTVGEMSKRELEKAVQEKKEADKIIAELKEELEAAKEAEADADARLEDAKKEIEQLKEAPQPEAKPSKEQLDKIKAEAKENAEKSLSELNQKVAELEEQKKKAEEAKTELEEKIKSIGKENGKQTESLKSEVAELRAKLKMSSSSEITEFKLYFEAVQTNINKMAEIINGIEDGGTADKLRAAISQLADKIKDII